MFIFLKLWLRIAARRPQETIFALLALGGFWYALLHNIPIAALRGPIYLTGVVFAAVLAAAFVPMFVESGTALNPTRLDLLPLSRRQRFVLTLLWRNPLRSLMLLAVVAATVGTLQPSNPETLTLIGIGAGAYVFAIWYEDRALTTAPTLSTFVAALLGYGSFGILLVSPATYPEVSYTPPLRVSSFLLGQQSGWVGELAIAVIFFLLPWALSRLPPLQLSHRKRRSRSRHARNGSGRHLPVSVLGPSYRKAILQLTRSSFGRSFILLGMVLTTLLMLADLPLLLPLSVLPWIAYLHNQEGLDLLEGGNLRYEMAGTEYQRRFVPRHLTAAGVWLMGVAVTAPGALLLPGRSAGPGALFAGVLGGVGTLLLSTMVGDIATTKHPKPIRLRGAQPGFLAPPALLYVAITLAAAGALLALSFATTSLIGAQGPSASLAFVTYGILTLTAYAGRSWLVR